MFSEKQLALLSTKNHQVGFIGTTDYLLKTYKQILFS